jgi:hypothetical protein
LPKAVSTTRTPYVVSPSVLLFCLTIRAPLVHPSDQRAHLIVFSYLTYLRHRALLVRTSYRTAYLDCCYPHNHGVIAIIQKCRYPPFTFSFIVRMLCRTFGTLQGCSNFEVAHGRLHVCQFCCQFFHAYPYLGASFYSIVLLAHPYFIGFLCLSYPAVIVSHTRTQSLFLPRLRSRTRRSTTNPVQLRWSCTSNWYIGTSALQRPSLVNANVSKPTKLALITPYTP